MDIEILNEQRLRYWCAQIDLPQAAVTERLSPQTIDEALDYAYHLRHVDTAFQRLGLIS